MQQIWEIRERTAERSAPEQEALRQEVVRLLRELLAE